MWFTYCNFVLNDTNSSSSSADVNNQPQDTDNHSSSIWDSFDKKVTESASHRTTTTEATIEVRRYLEEANIERKEDPLKWWKENQDDFPRLQKIAQKYLCIPGSSVPSKRPFSKARILVSERRNRIKPKNVDTNVIFKSKLGLT